MNNKQAKDLNDAIAHLQTELNRLDRLSAAALQVGTAEDLQVIRLLFSDGPLRVGELAARRASSVATVSARLDRLERRGLVVRERPPGDRRAVMAQLTDAGTEAAQSSRRMRTKALQSLDGDFPVDQIPPLVEAIKDRAELPATTSV